MAILVTGGVGFVSANIVRELAAQRHEAISLDVTPTDAILDAFLGDLSSYRLWHDLGWTPRYDLAAGLTDYVGWHRNSGFLD